MSFLSRSPMEPRGHNVAAKSPPTSTSALHSMEILSVVEWPPSIHSFTHAARKLTSWTDTYSTSERVGGGSADRKDDNIHGRVNSQCTCRPPPREHSCKPMQQRTAATCVGRLSHECRWFRAPHNSQPHLRIALSTVPPCHTPRKLRAQAAITKTPSRTERHYAHATSGRDT